VTTEVPLFGAVRGGAVKVLYHLLYATLFLALGVGLWTGRRWGYRLVFAGTLYYTLDKFLYLLDRETIEVHLMQQLQPYGEIFELIEKDSILQMMVLTTVLFVGCWWGFALYIYLRRGYFRF
jgi:predicted MFS family arabinose efflux permease